MTNALVAFQRNMIYAADLLAVSHVLDGITTAAVEVSDIRRAALTAGVSAQDTYFHHLVRELMVQACDGLRPQTDAYKRFAIPLHAAHKQTYLPAAIWLDQAVSEQIAHLSFQQPDKIADAVRLVSPVELWNSVADVLGETAKALKTTQKLIADRRNQIVHESDCELAPPHARRPLAHSDVADALDFLSRVVHAVDALV